MSPLRRGSYSTSGPEASQPFLGSNRREMVAGSHRNELSQRRLAERTSGRPPGGGARPMRMIASMASTSTAVSDSTLVIRTPTKRLPIRQDGAVILESAFQDDTNPLHRVILENIMRSSFFHEHEMEPKDQGPNDPITMGYGKKGYSVYGVFVQEVKKGEWQCLFEISGRPCSSSTTFKRFERAIEHIRSHVNHRPYACTGECNQGVTW
jgi:hypothetical protein